MESAMLIFAMRGEWQCRKQPLERECTSRRKYRDVVPVGAKIDYAARRNETTGKCCRPPRNSTSICTGPARLRSASTGA